MNDKFLILENLHRFFDIYKTHTHTAEQVSGLPTSLPANGGNADTVDGKHAANFLGSGSFIYKSHFELGIGNDLNEMVGDIHAFVYNVSNCPPNLSATYGFLDVYKFEGTGFNQSAPEDGGVILQVWHEWNTGIIHTRSRVKYIWSDWRSIFDDTSNPNLLINPDFKINQRGQTEYSDSNYSVDRWSVTTSNLVGKTTGIRVTESGITKTENAEISSVTQLLPDELINTINGKKCTISAGASNGEIISATFTCDTSLNPQSESANGADNKWNVALYHWNGYYGNRPCIVVGINDASITVNWAKLEFGGHATPFVPPDPTTELLKCQRYYQIRSTGDIPAVDLCPIMAKTPTVTQLSNGNYAYDAEIQ